MGTNYKKERNRESKGSWQPKQVPNKVPLTTVSISFKGKKAPRLFKVPTANLQKLKELLQPKKQTFANGRVTFTGCDYLKDFETQIQTVINF